MHERAFSPLPPIPYAGIPINLWLLDQISGHFCGFNKIVEFVI